MLLRIDVQWFYLIFTTTITLVTLDLGSKFAHWLGHNFNQANSGVATAWPQIQQILFICSRVVVGEMIFCDWKRAKTNLINWTFQTDRCWDQCRAEHHSARPARRYWLEIDTADVGTRMMEFRAWVAGKGGNNISKNFHHILKTPLQEHSLFLVKSACLLHGAWKTFQPPWQWDKLKPINIKP